MIKINSKSWHYKCHEFMFEDTPRSLCAYPWKVLLSLLLMTLCAVGALMLATGWIFGLLTPLFPALGATLPTILISYAVLGLMAYSFASLCRTKEGFWFKIRTLGSLEPAKEGSLSYFVKKQHSKICPLIKVI